MAEEYRRNATSIKFHFADVYVRLAGVRKTFCESKKHPA